MLMQPPIPLRRLLKPGDTVEVLLNGRLKLCDVLRTVPTLVVEEDSGARRAVDEGQVQRIFPKPACNRGLKSFQALMRTRREQRA